MFSQLLVLWRWAKSCCKFVNLSLFCSVCNWFVVGRELNPGPRLLPAESASGLPTTTTEEVATESTKPLLCDSGFDKDVAFPWVPQPSPTLRTILSNSSQLVRFHAIQSNYSRKPDWRPLYFSLTRRPTAFLLSLGLQAPLRGIATKTYAPWLHIFQFVSACYFFLSSNHLPGGTIFTASWVVAEVAFMEECLWALFCFWREF